MGLGNAEPMKGGSGYWVGIRNLEFYNQEFEKSMIKQTSDEYEVKSRNWIVELTAPEYLKMADKVFTLE